MGYCHTDSFLHPRQQTCSKCYYQDDDSQYNSLVGQGDPALRFSLAQLIEGLYPDVARGLKNLNQGQ